MTRFTYTAACKTVSEQIQLQVLLAASDAPPQTAVDYLRQGGRMLCIA
jgi:hypothetical protein